MGATSSAERDGTSSIAPEPASGADASSNSSATPSGDEQGEGSTGEEVDNGSEPGLEMPEAPEEEVESLTELLTPVRSGPLVSTPLPAAASARGRVVAGYPAFLRPVRSSQVETTSVSPSAGRLQVALAGTSALAPEQVLVAFRTRLSGRGLQEQDAPVTVAGARAAAFRRGDSTVTITVQARSGRTSYSVHATLRAGRD
ncbi:hypothetical protein F4692_000616 [Nocardioides cavernae]|uniref:Uncharacterized protein n=1 Tax=Nocardioides cavernae TaxID=1921566 RepID=A0A7Y9H035_9ACTN|nr:hypothetical protein [Nocardioides cavernae]NYE35512.1 hypothetical protein [Nocardioides cavernae]